MLKRTVAAVAVILVVGGAIAAFLFLDARRLEETSARDVFVTTAKERTDKLVARLYQAVQGACDPGRGGGGDR